MRAIPHAGILLGLLLVRIPAVAQISFELPSRIDVGIGASEFAHLDCADPVVLIGNDEGLVVVEMSGKEPQVQRRERVNGYVKAIAAGLLDGNPSVAYGDRSSRRILVARTGRDGRLSPAVSVPLPAPVREMKIRPVGSDGANALLVAHDEGFLVVRTKGTDSFRSTEVAAPAYPNCFELADLDSDGIGDLVIAGSEDQIDLFAGRADGTFSQTGTLRTGLRPQRLIVSDVDRDARPDIVVLGASGLTLHRQSPRGGFRSPETLWRVSHLSDLAVADLTNDGSEDLVVIDRSRGALTVLLNDGRGKFARGNSYLVGRGPERIMLADATADGRLDALSLDRLDGTLTLLPGLGGGNFKGALCILAETEDLAALTVADFDRDTNLDLAATGETDGTLSVFLGDGHGHFTSRPPRPIGRQPRALVAGDLDGDPLPDLAVANFGSDQLAILAGDGRGGFAAPILVSVGLGPVAVAAGAFGDAGHLDLAVANTLSDSVSLVYGDGHGRFDTTVNFPVIPRPSFLLVGDMNGDQIADLAVGSRNDESVAILYGDGKRLGEPEITSLVGVASLSVAEDFDDDGEVDLVVIDEMRDAINVMPGIGDGRFGSPIELPVGRHAHALVAGDFDGDGRPDLALVHRETRLISILLNRTHRPEREPAAEPEKWREA